MTFSRLLVVAALLGGASLARAQVLERTALPAFRAPTWALAAGVRTAYIKGAGFDPFSSNDAIVGFSLSGTRVLVRDGDLSLAAGVGLDLGTSSASARGVPARLSLTQVSALAEGRYQPWSRFYLFGRLAPGLMHGAATLDDHTSPNGSELTDGFDLFSLDVAAGGAFCLGAIGTARVGAWLVADGGYGWAPSHHLVLSPSLNGDQDKAGTLDLGTLAPRGGFFRIALALGY
ncbi:MAG TPA: hypothetical protein VN962_16415 [Polyangia bacterium]|nr:hypothetical protein [Polyangia bacterium]